MRLKQFAWVLRALAPCRAWLWLSLRPSQGQKPHFLPLHVNRPDAGGRACPPGFTAPVSQAWGASGWTMTWFPSKHLSRHPALTYRIRHKETRQKWTQADAQNISLPPKKRKQDRSNLFLFLEGVSDICLSWVHRDTVLAVYIYLCIRESPLSPWE